MRHETVETFGRYVPLPNGKNDVISEFVARQASVMIEEVMRRMMRGVNFSSIDRLHIEVNLQRKQRRSP